jgi:hypothetical protein
MENTVEQSANLFIVFSDKNKRQDVLTLLNDFLIPFKLSAHEVPCKIRRIAADIDIDGQYMTKHDEIINTIINAFMIVFMMVGQIPTYNISTRHRDDKKSYHVIFSGVVSDTATQKMIYKQVCDTLEQTPEGRFALPSLDNIYAKRSFALTGSFKNGHQLITSTENTNYADYMLNMTNVNDIDLSIEVPDASCVYNTKLLNDTIKIAARSDILGNYEVMEMTQNMYPLLRISPYDCIICHRTHGKANQCYLTSSVEYGIIVRCWRQPPDTTGITIMTAQEFNNFTDTDKPEEEKTPDPEPEKPHTRLQRYLKYQDTFPRFYKCNAYMTPNPTDIDERNSKMSVIEYNEPKVKEYPEMGDVLVRALMGLGKNEAVILTLTTAETKKPNLSILIISFRKTLGCEFTRSFSKFGMESYDKISGDIYVKNHPRIIVQVESLHRIQNAYDIVLFDEAESICDQLFSSTMKKDIMCYKTLDMILKHSGRVIAMDANLSSRSMNYINRFRQDRQKTFIHNTRGRPEQFADRGKEKPINHYTTSKSLTQAHIISKLDDNKKVVVAMTTSKESVIAFYDALCTKYPDKNIKCYTSLTDAETKKQDFENTSVAWANVDCLIYSPTLQAGVSFKDNHFDCFFGIFSAASCNVSSARQMIHRVRNFTDSNYYICLTGRPNTKLYQTSETDYIQHLETQSDAVLQDMLPAAVNLSKSPTGRKYIKSCPIFDLFVKTKVRNANDTTHYISEFLTQEYNSGVQGVYMDADTAQLDKIKNSLYDIVGFHINGSTVPEWKQLICFIRDNAERLTELDESVKPILRQYAQIAEDLAQVEQDAKIRAATPINNELPEFSKTAFIRLQQVENKEADLKLLAETHLIDFQQADRLTLKIEKEDTLTENERASLRVYMLNDHYHNQYKFGEIEANMDFIAHYMKPNVKSMYRNLCRLKGNYTSELIETRCREIEIEDKSKHAQFIANDETGTMAQHLLNLEKLQYRKYKIALDILDALQIEDITGPMEWGRDDLLVFLELNHTYIKDNLKEICPLFEKQSCKYKNSPGKESFVKCELQFINPILTTMFGVSIKAKGKGLKNKDVFVLNHDWNKHFKLNNVIDVEQDYPLWVETLATE